MARIVVNKHVSAATQVSADKFQNKGEIVISNEPGKEGIYLLNQNGEAVDSTVQVTKTVKAFSGSVVENYSTNEYTDQQDALVFNSAVTYTSGAVKNINNEITELNERVTSLSGASSASYESIVNNYATSASTVAAIAEAKQEAEAYTDDKPYFDAAEYNSTDKKIYFKHNGSVITAATIDATDFIKDGMVDNVYVSGANLVIVFNSDAGKETINIPISDIFNANNYYTKQEIDDKHFVNSAQTKIQIENYGYITAQDANASIAQVNASLSGLSGSVMSNYATSATTFLAIKALSGKTDSAISSLSANTETAIKTLSGTVDTVIEEFKELEAEDKQELEGKIASAITFTKTVSGNIETRINSVETSENEKISNLSGAVKTLSGNVVTEITTVSGNLMNVIAQQASAQTGGINELRSELNAFSAYVKTTYATSADTVSAISSLSGNVESAINDLKTAEDGKIEELSGKVTSAFTAITSAVSFTSEVSGNIETRINELASAEDTKISGLSGATILLSGATVTAVSSAFSYTDEVKTELDSKINSVSSGLTNLSAATIELSGSVAFNYATSANTVASISGAITQANSYTDSASGHIETTINSLSGVVRNLSASTDSEISQMKIKLIGVDSSIDGIKLTLSAVTRDIDKLSGATINGIASAFTYVNEVSGAIEGKISEVESSVSSVSGDVIGLSAATAAGIASAFSYTDTEISALAASLSGISGTSITAVQNIRFETLESDYSIGQDNIKYKKVGTDIVLDLSDMEINLGDY